MKGSWKQGLLGTLGLCLSVLFWVQMTGFSALPTEYNTQQTAAAPVSTAEDTVELPILMYHHILKDETRHNKFTISPADFIADLAYIQEQGYTCILVEDLLNFVEKGVPLPEKPIMLTFDDGYESFFAYAFPVLEDFNAKAVFSIVGFYTDQYSKIDDHHVSYSHCSWEQLYAMQSTGRVEIQNHSYNLHKNTGSRKGCKPMPGESQSEYRTMLTEDLSKVQNSAQALLGKSPTAFVYPFGYIHKETLPILKEMGFKAAFTCEEKLNFLSGDPEELFHLRRINRPHGTTAEDLLKRLQK